VSGVIFLFNRKSVISIITLCSLALSMVSGIGAANAPELYDEVLIECICLCEECEEVLMECICPCEDCEEVPDECTCVCDECDELLLECSCECEECEELLPECICPCEDCGDVDVPIDPEPAELPMDAVSVIVPKVAPSTDITTDATSASSPVSATSAALPMSATSIAARSGYTVVESFVVRLYRNVLSRSYDRDGLRGWNDALVGHGVTGAHVAHGFFFSDEFLRKRVSNAVYVDTLYRTLLNRNGEPQGRADWVAVLNSGASREHVFAGFVNSIEFGDLCARAGIIRGTYVPPPGAGTVVLDSEVIHSNSLAGKIIILDPGHGTVGSPGHGSYNEAVAMLDLARRIRPLLHAQGATVVLTRDHNTNTLISSRCAAINILALQEVRKTRTAASDRAEIDRLIGVMQLIISDPVRHGNTYMNIDPFSTSRRVHPDLQRVFEYQNDRAIRDNFLVISLHTNASSNTATRGADIFITDPAANATTRGYYDGYSYAAQSRNFGNTLLNHIQGTGIPRRGLTASNMAITREINVPSVLAENGFHTNAADRALLMNPAYMNQLAIAYQNAIIQYFN